MEQLTLDFWSGKMSPEHSAATKEPTLRRSSRKSSASSSRKPPILKCLKKDGLLGEGTTMKWEDDGAWYGELTMRNTGECPNAVAVSRLSQILEETPHPKYNLTAKACQGILRRAERRGKDLPERLKAVLLMQSAVVVLDMTHACDVIRECGEQVPALQARMETGGNQVPLTYSSQGFGGYKESSTASTYCARDFKDSTDLAITNIVVRRLTPLECTRLQGYPDGWVDIGDWTDEKGKKHKDADSPKYKALGNSIALPFWGWMLRRMARYLPEGATLGSLFDGIGGFPLIWERIHGRGTARWASEIEEFPIAVTKRHFKEEQYD